MEIAILIYLILAGIFIYVLGEVVIKIMIDPVQELKRVIAEIAFKLIHYSHVFKLSTADNSSAATPEKEIDAEKLEEAANEYRRLASLLNAAFRLVPFYGLTRIVFALPKEADIISARNALMDMSEEIFTTPKSFVISEKRKSIEMMLKVI
ncbi:hypothetical protein GWN26_06630 [Candidatus Saccharibacteria bacterium]|nr:hypothetical protein [Candidatus Saccharibacteria bacterium]